MQISRCVGAQKDWICARTEQKLQSVRRNGGFAHGLLPQYAGDFDGRVIIVVFILQAGTPRSCPKSFWDLPLAKCTPGHINPRTTQKSVVLGFAPSRRPYKASQSQNDLEQRLCADRMTDSPSYSAKMGMLGLRPLPPRLTVAASSDASSVVLLSWNS